MSGCGTCGAMCGSCFCGVSDDTLRLLRAKKAVAEALRPRKSSDKPLLKWDEEGMAYVGWLENDPMAEVFVQSGWSGEMGKWSLKIRLDDIDSSDKAKSLAEKLARVIKEEMER